MTPQEAKELLPIIEAFANGETIQHRVHGGNWDDYTYLQFTGHVDQYRIKPKPRPGPQPQDDVQALTARVQELEESLKDSEYTLEVTKKEVERQKEGWKTAHRERNNHFDQSCLNLQRAEAAEKRVQELEEKVRVFDDAWASREAEYAAVSTPTLRPIAEMPAEVPEGCVRIYTSQAGASWRALTAWKQETDTHFLDIRLPAPPDPDEELRREFEAWWESLQTKPPGKNELFIAFKAGRKA